MSDRPGGLARRLTSPPSAPPVPHFYAVDFARGLAALAVLVWHYQHFFYSQAGDTFPAALRGHLPLYSVLGFFYENGWRAVAFFWLISGFVFTAIYAAQPRGKGGGTRDFVVNRFARLYPLHLLTLLVVAGLQIVSRASVGHDQIYPSHSWRDFGLNLLMATRWGFTSADSFNGPIWSVSVEVLIYVLFWVTLPVLFRLGLLGPLLVAAVANVAAFQLFQSHAPVVECIFYFYLGACVYSFGAALGRRPWTLSALSLAAIAIGIGLYWKRPARAEAFGAPLLMAGTLLLLFAVELTERGRRIEALRWVGDNTYGTYLWHVPIQIAALIVMQGALHGQRVAYSPWFLLAFLALTIAVARLSFLTIERPARERLRRALKPRPPAPAA